jgi:hypothetical protein
VQLIAAELPADAFGAAITPGTYLLELASPSGTPMAWGAFEVIDDRPEPPIGDSAT